MAGKPFYVKMPKVMGVRVTGNLPNWVSAKDVILEMLRRHGVAGGLGKIFEYYGPGLKKLTAMDRHVIANMGAELGATTTVFPSDDVVKTFLKTVGREDIFKKITADNDAVYDLHEEINLSELEPLIALPGSPGNVVPVSEVSGKEIYQSYVGSSANPSLRDFAITALIVDGKQVHDRVSFDINPSSRQVLENLTSTGMLQKLIHSGARIHQAGCNGCIGMGQAPATGKISLRTVPRNFPGRSGTKDDSVYLCSPETAAASALSGVITDPRTLEMDYPAYHEPEKIIINNEMLIAPPDEGEIVELEKGPNIKPLPPLEPMSDRMEGPVLLKVGDNISTDEIMPAGTKVLPFRSNIPEISKFTFSRIDESYYERSLKFKESGSFIIGGNNYGQGSSREHAALGPRYLGVKAIIAKSFARIHWQNLCNFGILPLTFVDSDDWEKIDRDNLLVIEDAKNIIKSRKKICVINKSRNEHYEATHAMSDRQIEMVLAGSLINLVK
jgi:aconitate hydratase